ncbi:hypothetical protein CIB48_g6085 [Xylaria polymorpha]|nr:hypothetical protein CIB48_g6085 [Xylaria polymorpha]
MKALSEPILQGKMRKVTKATKRNKSRWRPIRPAIGSLYDVMHDHAGVPLFIPSTVLDRPPYEATRLSLRTTTSPHNTDPSYFIVNPKVNPKVIAIIASPAFPEHHHRPLF